jgi:hypothetical protein
VKSGSVSVTRKPAHLFTLILASNEMRIQARHRSIVKVIEEFIRKRVHFQWTENGLSLKRE